MSDRDRDETLRGEDLLADLAMQHEARRPDSPLYTNADVVAWLDQEASAPEGNAERWSAAQVRATAARIHAAASARLLQVHQETAAPRIRPATTVGTIPQVLDEAAALRAAPQLDLSAAAGVGRDLWDEPCESWVELPDDVPRGRYIAVRIKGESMTPLFNTGDLLLVHVDNAVESDRVVLARMPDGGYAVKKVGRVSATKLELVSLNPDFAAVVVPRQERGVIGTVVLCWRSQGGSMNGPRARNRRAP
jgi:phage repressor protein C with HTH and peptisase S24 domain